MFDTHKFFRVISIVYRFAVAPLLCHENPMPLTLQNELIILSCFIEVD